MSYTRPRNDFRIPSDLERKWTRTTIASGWVGLPSVMFERAAEMGLDTTDLAILSLLATYWWRLENRPHPAVGTMAKSLGVASRTVQRHLAALEGRGFIRRQERRRSREGSQTNIYHLDGLVGYLGIKADEKLLQQATRRSRRAPQA
jgi:DNA-binding transcriptional ArsR family regulator